MARHAVNSVVHQRILSARFPWSIFAINVAGFSSFLSVKSWLASVVLLLLTACFGAPDA